jgi:hypothetical protein
MLDAEFDLQLKMVTSSLAGEYQTLSVDSWTGPQGNPILGATVGPHILLATDTSGVPHTAAYVKGWTMDAVRLAQTEMNVKICSITGDNASNMQLSRELLDGADFFVYGCQAHKLHLAVRDLCNDKKRETMLKSVSTVNKAFRMTHVLAGCLKNNDLRRPVLACETRWGSVFKMLLYYNIHWAFLAQYAAMHLKPNNEVRRFLENMMLSRDVADLLAFLADTTSALLVMQAHWMTLGMAVELWLELLERPRPNLLS